MTTLIYLLGIVYVLLSLLGYLLLWRKNRQQGARITERDATLAAAERARDTARLDGFHDGWQACDEHWRQSALYQRIYGEIMVDVMGRITDHDACRQSGELVKS